MKKWMAVIDVGGAPEPAWWLSAEGEDDRPDLFDTRAAGEAEMLSETAIAAAAGIELDERLVEVEVATDGALTFEGVTLTPRQLREMRS